MKESWVASEVRSYNVYKHLRYSDRQGLAHNEIQRTFSPERSSEVCHE